MSRGIGADLEEKVDRDLAQRTFQGTLGHPATLLLVYFTTTLSEASPKGFWFGAAVLMALVLYRIPLLASKKKRNARQQSRWRWSMMIDIFASAAVWGIGNAAACAFDGCQSRNATLLVLYISAIAGAGVHLLVQSVRLVAVYLAVLMGPLAIVSAFQGTQGMWLSVATFFYYVYLVGQARRLHGQYWQQLRDNQQLAIRAHKDSLTELPNRFALRESLTRAVASAGQSGSSVPLLYIDMDGFKQINDRFSHRIGDLFLCEVANRLRSCCEPVGVPFRLGGDEFTVLLSEGTSPEDASRFARELLARIQEPMNIDGHLLIASASIGLSVFPQDCNDEEDLLRTADHAMYFAKFSAKGSYQLFQDARRSARFSANDLARDIREALEKGQFDLHYQPQVNRRGELAGLEALLRWTHPTRGNMPPLEFIPVAEETGQIVAIGFWVLRQVCEQGNAWLSEGCEPIPISVNVSPVQLDQPGFVDHLFRILRETGFSPSMLTLEITEGALQGKRKSALAHLEQIRDLGVKIAIDDFGTGHSSLSRIGELPIDIVKLDRTFVSAIRSPDDRAPIIEAVLAMSRALNFDVIAEGIEVPGQFEALTRMGCELFQGYYFGKASPAGSVRQYWRKSESAELFLAPAE